MRRLAQGFGLGIAACLLLAAGPAQAKESVVFKILAVNPSESDSKDVTIKGVLPPEVKAENVLDPDGLTVEYDSQLGAYFVSGSVTLKPRGSMVKNILIEDVWVVPDAQFDRLDAEVDEIMKKLAGTSFLDRGQIMADAIDRHIREVRSHQRLPFVNPETHISQYREDLKQLQMVETEMVSLRQLMVMAALNPAGAPVVVADAGGGAGAEGGARDGLSVLTTWRIVFMILGLLGVVSVSFFFIWQRQLKAQLARQAAQPASSDPLFSGGSGGSAGVPGNSASGPPPPPKAPFPS